MRNQNVLGRTAKEHESCVWESETAMGWILLPKRLDLTRDREALAELGGFARRAAGVGCAEAAGLLTGGHQDQARDDGQEFRLHPGVSLRTPS